MKNYFYVVRHGESEGNIRGDIFGADPPLTKKGVEQAIILAERIQKITIDEIHSSNLKRASQTAKIIASKKNKKVVETVFLRERFFGSIEGLTQEEAKKIHGTKMKKFFDLPDRDKLSFKLTEDTESFNEAFDRVISYLKKLTSSSKEKNYLIVSHANVMIALLVKLGFATFGQLPNGSIKNGSYLKIISDGGKYKLVDAIGIRKRE